jgi:NhaP-type Na+/H+ or K+/H+ antiporter
VIVARKVITFDKGSKLRLKEIRWKLVEVFTLALLAVFLFAMTIFVMMWELHDVHPDPAPTKVPQIRDAEPKEP